VGNNLKNKGVRSFKGYTALVFFQKKLLNFIFLNYLKGDRWEFGVIWVGDNLKNKGYIAFKGLVFKGYAAFEKINI
jgi:hypothetical protein